MVGVTALHITFTKSVLFSETVEKLKTEIILAKEKHEEESDANPERIQ